MKPLISRVRTGDILSGTRNLRTYLQTASLWRVLAHQDMYRQMNRGKRNAIVPGGPSLYVPDKDDKFVVAANTSDTFAVWSTKQKVVLLFVNPTPDTLPKRDKHRPHSSVNPNPENNIIVPRVKPRNLRDLGRQGMVRMSPEMFSSWFIKTKGKNPSLKNWPDYAWYLYVTMQLNTGCGSGRGADAVFGKVLPFSMRADTGDDSDAEIPFMLVEWNESYARSRVDVTKKVNRLITQGITRPKSRKTPLLGFNKGTGPLLDDIERMRTSIRGLTRDPQDRKRLDEQFKDVQPLKQIISKLLDQLEESELI